METKNFSQSCEHINSHLAGLEASKAFNSIGSNILVEFGPTQDWSIWLSDTTWRLTKDDTYIVGSADSQAKIKQSIEQILKKPFQSLHFLSSFLDLEINFGDGYQLTTFFNWQGEDLWSIFAPDQDEIGIDCSTKDEIKNTQLLAGQVHLVDKFVKTPSAFEGLSISDVSLDSASKVTLLFGNNNSIPLENCAWRLEKESDYLVGSSDRRKDKEALKNLIGKKLIQIQTANSLMDNKLIFADDYILKTFTSRLTPS